MSRWFRLLRLWRSSMRSPDNFTIMNGLRPVRVKSRTELAPIHFDIRVQSRESHACGGITLHTEHGRVVCRWEALLKRLHFAQYTSDQVLFSRSPRQGKPRTFSMVFNNCGEIECTAAIEWNMIERSLLLSTLMIKVIQSSKLSGCIGITLQM